MDGKLLTWSSRFWTMISCPEAAASIRGVKPEPGSLWMKEKSNENFCLTVSVAVVLEWMKTLTWHWYRRCYPAGTSPSAGGLCWCSETERSSLESPSAPTLHLAFGVKKKNPFILKSNKAQLIENTTKPTFLHLFDRASLESSRCWNSLLVCWFQLPEIFS